MFFRSVLSYVSNRSLNNTVLRKNTNTFPVVFHGAVHDSRTDKPSFPNGMSAAAAAAKAAAVL